MILHFSRSASYRIIQVNDCVETIRPVARGNCKIQLHSQSNLISLYASLKRNNTHVHHMTLSVLMLRFSLNDFENCLKKYIRRDIATYISV